MITRALVVIGIFLTTGAGVQWLTRPEPRIERVALSQLETSFEGWRSTEFPLESKVLDTLGLDDHVSRVYEQTGRPPVSLYIGYYATQRTGQTIHSPLKCLPGTGWQPIERSVQSVDVTDANGHAQKLVVNRYVVQKGLERHLVMFWYQMRGQVVSSEYVAKLYLIDGAIRTNRTDGALVRVIVPLAQNGADVSSDETAVSFIKLLFPKLRAHLPV